MADIAADIAKLSAISLKYPPFNYSLSISTSIPSSSLLCYIIRDNIYNSVQYLHQFPQNMK